MRVDSGTNVERPSAASATPDGKSGDKVKCAELDTQTHHLSHLHSVRLERPVMDPSSSPGGVHEEQSKGAAWASLVPGVREPPYKGPWVSQPDATTLYEVAFQC